MVRNSALCNSLACRSRPATVCFFLLSIQLAALTVVSGSQVEQALYNRLVNGPRTNNRQLRPVKNHVHPVRVGLRVSMVDVINLDDSLSQVTVKLWLSLRWKDEYLIWNPSQYDGIRRMNMATGPDSKIWTPDITMFNALNTNPQPGGNTDAVVTSDGTVTWVRPVIYTVSAQHEFRTNSWSSSFRFGSWSYDTSRVDLQPDVSLEATEGNVIPGASSDSAVSIRMDTENFFQTDHWSILDSRGRVETSTYPCCPNEAYSSVTFSLKLRKKVGPSLLGRRGI